MRISSFPSCCGARVIVDFGAGYAGAESESHTKQQVIAWVADQLHKLKSVAVVYAMPTSSQPNAIAALEELGFYTHPNPDICYNSSGAKRHKLLPYFIAPKEFDLKGFNSRYNPEEDDYENKPNNGIDQIGADKRSGGYRW